MDISLQKLCSAISGTLYGIPSDIVSEVSPLESATEKSVTFVLEPKFIKVAQNSQAKAFITFEKIEGIQNQIVVTHPRHAMAQTLSLFFPAPSDTLTDAISALSSIGKGTTYGDKAVIMPHVTIGSGCKIGKNVRLYPNVVIYDNVIIGDYVTIHAGSVIGCDGFGYFDDLDRVHHKMPHVGSVIIEDHVEIGANCVIDRGVLGNTTIGSGTKIDNLVHIAHNSTIGSHCLIAAQSGLVGSATLSDHVTLGGQVGIGAVTVAENVTVAAKAGVTKNIQANQIVSGFPAKNHATQLKEAAALQRLAKQNRLAKPQ